MNKTDSIKNLCFFCSQPITDKKTQEHIIANSLLKRLGIKEETVTGKGVFQYSRIKVPAHKSCNNNFGSEYENKILNLLDNPEKLYQDLIIENEAMPLYYSPNNSKSLIISTWLTKIYYGLFYNDYLKIDDESYKQEIANNILNTENFRIIQQAYREGKGFCLPSSLYVFKSNKDFFYLKTFPDPKTIMIKINKLVFILSIEDGYLTKNYFNNNHLKKFQEMLSNEEKKSKTFSLHLFAMSEIIALRLCIPKSPSFIFSKNEIINTSFSTMVKNPNKYYKIDEYTVEKLRNEILNEMITQ